MGTGTRCAHRVGWNGSAGVQTVVDAEHALVVAPGTTALKIVADLRETAVPAARGLLFTGTFV
jgi:hypothetical protein